MHEASLSHPRRQINDLTRVTGREENRRQATEEDRMAWNIEGQYFENCSCNVPCPCTVSLDLGADRDRWS